MKQNLICAAVVFTTLALSACKRAPETPAPAAATSSPASSATSPMQGITPHEPETAAAKPSTGPAEAGTAVGGMVGHQDQGGAASTTSQTTGGDGARK